MYFAELDQDKKVIRVIVADQEFIDSGAVGDPSNWVETKEENYAGVGHTYEQNKKEFIRPETRKPTPEEILEVENRIKGIK